MARCSCSGGQQQRRVAVGLRVIMMCMRHASMRAAAPPAIAGTKLRPAASSPGAHELAIGTTNMFAQVRLPPALWRHAMCTVPQLGCCAPTAVRGSVLRIKPCARDGIQHRALHYVS